MTIQKARELLGNEALDLSDAEFDKRLDMFAEFFLDRILEKIKNDKATKVLRGSKNGGMVKV